MAVQEALFFAKAGNGRKGTHRWKTLLTWEAAAVMRGLWKGFEQGSANRRKLGRGALQNRALAFRSIGSVHG